MSAALEYRIASCGGKYRPEFRRGHETKWWFVRRQGKPMDFATATAAKIAADQIVALDEASRSPAHIIEVEPSPLGSIEDWKRDREANLSAERQRVFGDHAATTKAFVDGRYVRSAPPKVEHVGKRARA